MQKRLNIVIMSLVLGALSPTPGNGSENPDTGAPVNSPKGTQQKPKKIDDEAYTNMVNNIKQANTELPNDLISLVTAYSYIPKNPFDMTIYLEPATDKFLTKNNHKLPQNKNEPPRKNKILRVTSLEYIAGPNPQISGCELRNKIALTAGLLPNHFEVQIWEYKGKRYSDDLIVKDKELYSVADLKNYVFALSIPPQMQPTVAQYIKTQRSGPKATQNKQSIDSTVCQRASNFYNNYLKGQ